MNPQSEQEVFVKEPLIIDKAEIEKRKDTITEILKKVNTDEAKFVCEARIAEINFILSLSTSAEAVWNEARKMDEQLEETFYWINYQDYVYSLTNK